MPFEPRDTRLTDDAEGKFMRAKDVADWLRPGSGQYYQTNGDVHDVPDSLRMVGILESIHSMLVEHTKTRTHSDAEKLEGHSQYLQSYYYDRDNRLIADGRTHSARIVDMCGGYSRELGRARCLFRFGFSDIRKELARRYVKAEISNSATFWKSYWNLAKDLESAVDRMKVVRRVDDLIKLNGIGKGSVAKIKARLKTQKLRGE